MLENKFKMYLCKIFLSKKMYVLIELHVYVFHHHIIYVSMMCIYVLDFIQNVILFNF